MLGIWCTFWNLGIWEKNSSTPLVGAGNSACSRKSQPLWQLSSVQNPCWFVNLHGLMNPPVNTLGIGDDHCQSWTIATTKCNDTERVWNTLGMIWGSWDSTWNSWISCGETSHWSPWSSALVGKKRSGEVAECWRWSGRIYGENHEGGGQKRQGVRLHDSALGACGQLFFSRHVGWLLVARHFCVLLKCLGRAI